MDESVATRQSKFQTPAKTDNTVVFAITSVVNRYTIPLALMDRCITLTNSSSIRLLYVVGPPGSTPSPTSAAGVLGSTTTCAALPANQSVRFRFESGIDGVLAMVSSGVNFTVRMSASSNQEGYALGNPPGQP